MTTSCISIVNAKTHNLRGVDLKIPHNKLTVITGVSGSGKSSLAIDTLYAEGQRQYIESLSTYARQFLNQLQRPDVEVIEGLQPTLCIDQKVASSNRRSTVATITEIYDYLRLLMARVGTPSCPSCGSPINQQSPDRILRELLSLPHRTKLVVMAPVVRGRRGSHRDKLEEIRKAGLVRVRVDGETYEVDEVPALPTRQNHTIEAVVDRIIVREDSAERIEAALSLALKLSSGLVTVSLAIPSEQEDSEWEDRLFSTRYACANCDVSIEEIEPRTFSFNSPYGACPDCEGIGLQEQVSAQRLVQDWSGSLEKGAFGWLNDLPAKWKKKTKSEIASVLSKFDLEPNQTLEKLTTKQREQLLHGTKKQRGLHPALEAMLEDVSDELWELFAVLMQELPCTVCQGARLRPEALAVTIEGKNIFEICSMSLASSLVWFSELKLGGHQNEIATPILNEMLHRLKFLNKVGVGYLTLARHGDTLSGGELQRVRLATSIGSGLVGVSYILDEPSIGLHQRDNDRLIESLRDLQQQGNTVVVVEHDEAMMREADLLVDVGPGAGTDGGEVVVADTPKRVINKKDSLTAEYLRADRRVKRESEIRKPSAKSRWLKLDGASLHNLKNVNLQVPLGMLIGVTGVSGSGKSSLFSHTLVPALLDQIGQASRPFGQFRKLSGAGQIDKLIEVTQTPIGRSPRSTPATYCGVFDLIRKVWAGTRDAKQRGYSSSRFSFNAGAGRCSQCQGQGQEKIEMQFLPDLYVGCAACGGSRYNRQTLAVRYKEKTIADVLAMNVREAAEFFVNFSKIHRLLHCLEMVGLGYLALGQSSSTLSGGEAQRIKLAAELSKPDTGRTIYFLDEPTTGLHFADVQRLVNVLDGLVAKGNTVIVIEHNLDLIRCCDWLIDLGPEGGEQGGKTIAAGPPSEISKSHESLTGKYL
ncbi:MAG: excinuclease ABC subunit UvrA [Planctomycetota bacterium]|nr:excinuclease ABC subunit UvrA [Planctomycetota bacterium]